MTAASRRCGGPESIGDNMNKSLLLLSMLVPLSFSGCEVFDDEESEYLHDQWASVYSVQVLSVTEGSVEFLCQISIPTPCNEFDRLQVSREDTVIIVRYYSKIKKAQACVDMIGSFEKAFSTKVPGGSEYDFHFWRLGESPLDTSIYVP
jgi:hypothetical protein